MGTGAGLNADQADWSALEKRQKLTSQQLPSHHDLPVVIHAMDLDDILGEVDIDRADYVYGWLLYFWTITAYHAASRRREQGPSTPSIEMAFSKLKAHLRRIGARTFTDMFHALSDICDLYSQDECWIYFKAAGSASG